MGVYHFEVIHLQGIEYPTHLVLDWWKCRNGEGFRDVLIQQFKNVKDPTYSWLCSVHYCHLLSFLSLFPRDKAYDQNGLQGPTLPSLYPVKEINEAAPSRSRNVLSQMPLADIIMLCVFNWIWWLAQPWANNQMGLCSLIYNGVTWHSIRARGGLFIPQESCPTWYMFG